MTLYSFSISHPTHTHHWWHLGLSRTEKGRKKKRTFDARPSCSDKILKQFSAHSAVTALQIFCFKIKGWPPLLLLHFTSPLLINYASFVLLVLSVSCSPRLVAVLALARTYFRGSLCEKESERESTYAWHRNKQWLRLEIKWRVCLTQAGL